MPALLTVHGRERLQPHRHPGGILQILEQGHRLDGDATRLVVVPSQHVDHGDCRQRVGGLEAVPAVRATATTSSSSGGAASMSRFINRA